jgi:hypothetical protein
VQNITGPDGHTYTLDTYVDDSNDEAAGLALKLVTVVVRDASTGKVLANDASAFHSS